MACAREYTPAHHAPSECRWEVLWLVCVHATRRGVRDRKLTSLVNSRKSNRTVTFDLMHTRTVGIETFVVFRCGRFPVGWSLPKQRPRVFSIEMNDLVVLLKIVPEEEQVQGRGLQSPCDGNNRAWFLQFNNLFQSLHRLSQLPSSTSWNAFLAVITFAPPLPRDCTLFLKCDNFGKKKGTKFSPVRRWIRTS